MGHRVRFTDPQMSGFNGYMGRVKFENGVSVEELSQVDERMIGALKRIERVDTGEQAGANAEFQAAYHARQAASVDPGPEAKNPDGGPAEQREPDVTHVAPEKAPEPTELDALEKTLETEAEPEVVATAETVETVETPRIWTREELEKVADADGIRGLREIGDKIGVKNTSIAGLIAEILAAQANPKVSN